MRWQSQRIDHEAARRLPGYREARVRTFEAPEALGIEFLEVEARSALNKVPGRSLPFNWTVNPYRGCTHACVQCFARPSHRYLDLNPREDFERRIVVKVNVAERLRAELRRPSWAGEHVALGTNTDPYQWVEGRYELTRSIWEVMVEARNPCSVLTRSPLLLRDLDLFRELVAVTEFAANLSIPTIDEKVWRQTEPHSPNPMKRIEAVAELTRAGIPCGVLIAPLMPGINDDPAQVERIVALCDEAGAKNIGGIPLHLRGELREIFFDWLRERRPDLVERYERLYARGGYLPRVEQERLLAATGRPGRRVQRNEEGGGSAEPRRRDRRAAGRRSEARAEAEPPVPDQATLF